jgi:hypothetical protein
MRRLFTRFLAIAFLSFASLPVDAQQPPKTDRTGSPVSIVRNEATVAVTIEYRSNSQWQPLKLEPGSDVRTSGDRLRVATTREDKAIITVDLPIQAGQKYRLIWNEQAGMWDFSPAS